MNVCILGSQGNTKQQPIHKPSHYTVSVPVITLEKKREKKARLSI